MRLPTTVVWADAPSLRERAAAQALETPSFDPVAFLTGGAAGFAAAGRNRAASAIARPLAWKPAWKIDFRYYRNARGIGVTITQNGRRMFGLDWHQFTLNGKVVNRPHYHSRPGIGRHRPWQ